MSAGDACERCLRFTDHHDFMSERLNQLGDLMGAMATKVGARSASVPLMSAGDACERCLRFTDHHDFMSERLNQLGDLMGAMATKVGARSARSS